jgi:putative FmdB family regulatory protein
MCRVLIFATEFAPALASRLREGGSVPTYQYTCTHCGEPVEAVQKFTDAPLTVCAACGGRLRKVFSPVGIVFKGSGFYRTDSRNGSSAAATATKDKQTSDSGSSSGDSAANGSGPGDNHKSAAKKSGEAASSPGAAKSSSSSEKVA